MSWLSDLFRDTLPPPSELELQTEARLAERKAHRIAHADRIEAGKSQARRERWQRDPLRQVQS